MEENKIRGQAGGQEAEAPALEEKLGREEQERMENCLRIGGIGRWIHLGFWRGSDFFF